MMFEWCNLKSKTENGYKLLENEKPVVTILLADKKSSFKATLIIDELNYKIKRKGFWKSIIVVLNKKDEVVARAGFEKMHYGRGVIEINKARYYYKFVNTPLAELILFQKEIQPLASYKIAVKNKQITAELNTDKSLYKTKDKLLLLSIGWYIFQPIVKENVITNWV